MRLDGSPSMLRPGSKDLSEPVVSASNLIGFGSIALLTKKLQIPVRVGPPFRERDNVIELKILITPTPGAFTIISSPNPILNMPWYCPASLLCGSDWEFG